MNPPDKETPGTGGGLRYHTKEAAPGMVNQAHSHSCQAACARQLLKDAGVDISEADLLARIGYYEGIGTLAKPTAAMLSKLHPNLNYQGGEINENEIRLICSRDPWIANVLTDHGTVHSVIVDRLDGDTVHVRDPWGLDGPGSASGTVATINLADLLEHWRWTFFTGIIPVGRK
jgi:hypothetical protein